MKLLLLFAAVCLTFACASSIGPGPAEPSGTDGGVSAPVEGREEVVSPEAETGAEAESGGTAEKVPRSDEPSSEAYSRGGGQTEEPFVLPSPAQLRRQIAGAVRPLVLVETGGGPPTIVDDLDRDGTVEIITVAAQTAGDLSSQDLADLNAVFDPERRPSRFYLIILGLDGQVLRVVGRSDLGEKLVFGNLRLLSLRSDSAEPFAVIVTFHSPLGQLHEWRIFDGRARTPISSLSLQETHGSRVRVEDIDGDRVLDVVVSERGIEEGIGYETILTWYRWDGRRFARWNVVNVVRNLRSFLADSRRLLLERDWRALVAHSFDPEQVRSLRKQGLSNADIVLRGLGLEPFFEGQAKEAGAILSEITEVIHPQILEDPFVASDARGDHFLMALRLTDSIGISRVVEVPLYMRRNPFGARQFYFLIR